MSEVHPRVLPGLSGNFRSSGEWRPLTLLCASCVPPVEKHASPRAIASSVWHGGAHECGAPWGATPGATPRPGTSKDGSRTRKDRSSFEEDQLGTWKDRRSFEEDGSGTEEDGSGTEEDGSGTEEEGSGTEEDGSGTEEDGSGTEEDGSGTEEDGSGTEEDGS